MKVSIVIPTYNERENIPLICNGISLQIQKDWDYEIIFVDDNSPDGTSSEIQSQAQYDPRVKLVERPGKLGLGSAITRGFQEASGDYWIMMDADMSHRPEDLPRMLLALSTVDIAIGSRYVPGGSTPNWPYHRRITSRFASWLARYLLDLDIMDLTTGFLAFRSSRIRDILPLLDPKGFKIGLEILAKSSHLSHKEVPIEFVDRLYGKSKMSMGEVITFIKLCLHLRK